MLSFVDWIVVVRTISGSVKNVARLVALLSGVCHILERSGKLIEV